MTEWPQWKEIPLAFVCNCQWADNWYDVFIFNVVILYSVGFMYNKWMNEWICCYTLSMYTESTDLLPQVWSITWPSEFRTYRYRRRMDGSYLRQLVQQLWYLWSGLVPGVKQVCDDDLPRPMLVVSSLGSVVFLITFALSSTTPFDCGCCCCSSWWLTYDAVYSIANIVKLQILLNTTWLKLRSVYFAGRVHSNKRKATVWYLSVRLSLHMYFVMLMRYN